LAVTEVNEIYEGRRGSFREQELKKVVREYRRTFLVTTTSFYDEAVTIRSAAGVPRIGDFYVNAGGVLDVGAWCRSVECEQRDHDPLKWKVVCEYSSETDDPDRKEGPGQDARDQSGRGQEDKKLDNPLLRPPEVEWDGVDYTRVVDQDIFGDPIVNSAGARFDPPLEQDDSRLVLRYTRNEATFNQELAEEFVNALNSDSFLGRPPYTWLCKKFAGRRQTEDAGVYWQVFYEFHYNRDTWFRSVLDQGYYEKHAGTDGKPKNFVDRTNQPVSEPLLLDGFGRRLPFAASTTLAGLVAATDTSISVSGFALPLPDYNGFLIDINTETLLVTAGAGTATWTVTRAQAGTEARAHSSGSVVSTRSTPVFLALEIHEARPFATLGITL
jgi:hypothetical protein